METILILLRVIGSFFGVVIGMYVLLHIVMWVETKITINNKD